MSSSASAWTDRRVSREEALERLARLPESSTKHGVAVPFPFVDRKVYEDKVPSGEINERIKGAPIRSIKLSDLHAIQHSVKPKRVAQYIRDPSLRPPGDLHPKAGTPVDHPIAIRYGGKLYLHDGHHRATAAVLRGKTHIDGRYVDLDDAAGSSSRAA